MKIIKKATLGLVSFIIPIFLLTSIPVFAATGSNINIEETETIDENTKSYSNSDGSFNPDSTLPNVTVDQFVDKINKKQYDVIHALQKWATPFLTIVLIICLIAGLISFVTKGKKTTAYIIGVLISGIILAAIEMAPQIIIAISNWAIS